MKTYARCFLLLLILLSYAALSAAQDHRPDSNEQTPVSSETFTSAEGNFTVSLPAKPAQQFTQPIEGNESVILHMFAWEISLVQYSIGYLDMAIDLEEPTFSKTLLDQLRDGEVKKENGKLLAEKEVELDGHVGREFKIEAADGLFIDRIYLVKKRVYILSVFIPAAKQSQEPATSIVLNSFKLATSNVETLGEVDRLLKELKVKNEKVLSGCKDEAKCSPLLIGDNATAGAAEVKNGKVINMPQPAYPPIARAAHAAGTVQIQVVIDESGKVIAAQALSGHPLLQAAALKAARGLLVTPSFLDGKPVKVVGVVNYNFVPK